MILKNRKGHFLAAFVLLSALTAQAEERRIERLHITAAQTSLPAFRTDSTDIDGKAWDDPKTLLQNATNLTAWKSAPSTADSILSAPTSDAVRLAGFTLTNRNFAQIEVKTKGVGENSEIYVDGKQGAKHDLAPGEHDVSVKFLQKSGKADTLSVSIVSDQDYSVLADGEKHPYTLATLMYGERIGAVSLSADGRYAIMNLNTTDKEGKVTTQKYLIDTKTGSRSIVSDFSQWSSAGHVYIATHKNADGTEQLTRVDAQSMERTPFFLNQSGESGRLEPGEKWMLINKESKGPEKDKEVYQIMQPDDRIDGWRNRNNVLLLNTENGQLQTITQGQHSTYGSLSPDQTKMLLLISENDITRRPFTFMTAVVLDLQSMKADTLFAHDGFVGMGQWSPDGKTIVFSGSPEAFNGIGNRVPKGMTPSMIENELYAVDVATKQVRCLTADLDPSIINWQWSRADGMIYALTENRDNQDIFRINPKDGSSEMLKLSERFVFSFDIAYDAPTLIYRGQGHSTTDRCWTVNLKNGKETLLEDLNPTRLKDIELGEFGEWNFKAERGDTIYGRYYLPPHFDASQKYPMLVYYYGGCSPVGRYLDSYYSFHGWAAMGYVVYVIQPSGCTGFGQEFSARHVNAYGDYTADDIIQGTKQFCAEHSFVNKDKIGCLGASYGGFMTQYLQTQTDIFAAAMSHAGISDPTSYWGFGYWGYSYSTISAANSYPWNNKELFTDHAPLTLADRVHTPLLFMHGTADTNVPINESIQMYNALKILGRPTAFVAVEGQNHHILDYSKRIKWTHTWYAWFQRWLKDDPTWWNTLYPEKTIQ